MSGILQKIKDSKDLSEVVFKIEKWDVELLIIEPVRRVILEMQSKYLKKTTNEKGEEVYVEGSMEKFGTACIVEMLHDMDRGRVFKNIEEADEVLGEKSSIVQLQLIEACQNLIKAPDEEKVKDAEGNSDGMKS